MERNRCVLAEGDPIRGPRQALMSTVLHFCFLVPGLVFGLCTLNVVTDSMLTKAVSASDTGECRRRGPPLWEPAELPGGRAEGQATWA